jgi:hypothetical protein
MSCRHLGCPLLQQGVADWPLTSLTAFVRRAVRFEPVNFVLAAGAHVAHRGPRDASGQGLGRGSGAGGGSWSEKIGAGFRILRARAPPATWPSRGRDERKCGQTHLPMPCRLRALSCRATRVPSGTGAGYPGETCTMEPRCTRALCRRVALGRQTRRRQGAILAIREKASATRTVWTAPIGRRCGAEPTIAHCLAPVSCIV